jgi:predicted helicase
VNASHARAGHWIRQGIFDDLEAFSSLEERVNLLTEEKDRGDVFEIFIEGYLATQAITQHSQHWVVGKIPPSVREQHQLPSDGTGIDGVYETADGTNVAYQVKYRQKRHLTYGEVSSFLGITERFSERVIFTNAMSLSRIAAERTRWVNGETFQSLSTAALAQITAWLREKSQPIIKASPDPRYQTSALADIAKSLKENDRANVVMASGTGKTLVSLWAVEQENPSSVLVLLPSLSLLRQTLREWSKQTNLDGGFSYLCVCSDKTIGLKDDTLELDPSEIEFPIETDPAVVRRFLNTKTGRVKIVFSTYQSAESIASILPRGLETISYCGHCVICMSLLQSLVHPTYRTPFFWPATLARSVGFRRQAGDHGQTMEIVPFGKPPARFTYL